ncbi:MAG: GNAT family N-acetyltransferase [Candidatus Omnitrophica bacterium]|nr:GNAT family N-acetyltransferase [Candidatus Omnitrophota bacterium]MDD5352396.1 GNAT family N-acetyltransferase [Candidatus Omnitrophota bacterium]MDD5549994.1 GNAT family N-acetyltransferase [Candidatus Omnitrophota bacterium]
MGNKETYFIEGKRIFLRNIVPEDINENYCRWMNDQDINKYMETRYFPHTIEDIKQYVEKIHNNPEQIFLAICLKNEKQHIGNIKLGPINWIHRVGEISLFIGEKACWGKGYATEAIKLISNYAFYKLNLRKLTAGCYANNIGSLLAFQKANFVQEAILKNQYFCDGVYVNKICLALFSKTKE